MFVLRRKTWIWVRLLLWLLLLSLTVVLSSCTLFPLCFWPLVSSWRTLSSRCFFTNLLYSPCISLLPYWVPGDVIIPTKNHFAPFGVIVVLYVLCKSERLLTHWFSASCTPSSFVFLFVLKNRRRRIRNVDLFTSHVRLRFVDQNRVSVDSLCDRRFCWIWLPIILRHWSTSASLKFGGSCS
jgi:hypothetical protein